MAHHEKELKKSTSDVLRDAVLRRIKTGIDPFPQVLGQDGTKRAVLSGLISGRNVIIIGFPGVGKTTLARAVSELLPPVKAVSGCPFHCDPKNPACPACIEAKKKGVKPNSTTVPGASRFVRVQGSPDLCVEDLLGDLDPLKALEFGPTDPQAFTPGKLLRANRGVLFFDEINRCPERLQNTLLQVVEEGRATIGNYELDYPSDFVMVATMNPAEYVGVERMSDVLMDRFDVVRMGYPETQELEERIVARKGKNLGVVVPENVLSGIVHLVRLTRDDERISRPAGLRASIGLFERAQSNALLDGRREAIISDVLDVAESVLSHKLKLSPKHKHTTSPEDVVKDLSEKARDAFSKRKPPPAAKTGPSESKSASPPASPSPSPSTKTESPPASARLSQDARLIRSMTNRGIIGVDSKFLAKSMIIDIKSALGTYGENVIEGLSGRTILALKRFKGDRAMIVRLAETIDERLQALRDDGLLDEDGATSGGLELAGLDLLSDELKELGEETGVGEHESQVRGAARGSSIVDIVPYRKGTHAYNSLALRKIIRTAIRHGRKKISRDDLHVFERAKRAGIDFVFAIDTSGSMRGEKIDAAKRAAIGLAYTSLRERDRVAVISFKNTAERVVGLRESGDILDFAKRMAGLSPSHTTNIAAGLQRSIDVLAEEETSTHGGRNKHIILITDAMPTAGARPVDTTLELVQVACEQWKTTVSVIGITLTPDGESLARRIAGIGGGEFYHVRRASDIRDAVLGDAGRVRKRAEAESRGKNI